MTFKKSKATSELLCSFSPERTKIRSLLRKASQGNISAFTQVAAAYTNLISEYLYLCGLTEAQHRNTSIQRVLVDCWRYLPYTRRVSDFERFLQVQLEKTASHISTDKLDAQHPALSSLNHTERFLLAARVFENWTFKSLKLSLRKSKIDISHELTKLKCKLTDFKLHLLKGYEAMQVGQVNDLLEGKFSSKKARKVEQELAGQYHAHQFKANWLSYRCELADLRLNMTLSDIELKQLSENISEVLKQEPMERPRLSDSLINQISFVRMPSI